MSSVVLEVALGVARRHAFVEHVDVEPTGFAQLELRTEKIDRHAGAIDRLLVLNIRFGVIREKLIELVFVATPTIDVSPRVAVRRTIFDQRLLHVDLRTKAQAGIRTGCVEGDGIGVASIGGNAFVNDGHEDRDHRREQTGEKHQPDEVEQTDLRPGQTISATHFAILRIVEPNATVVTLFTTRQFFVFDDDLFFGQR